MNDRLCKLAYIHGAICGDGRLDKKPVRSKPRISHRETSPDKVGFCYRILFYNKNMDLLFKFAELVKEFFEKEAKIRLNKYEARICSKDIYIFLKSIGNTSSYGWEFPSMVFTKEALNYWLKAFFDCEATVGKYGYHKYIAIKTVNGNGINKIRDYLISIGIDCKINGPYSHEGTTFYYLKIYKKKNLIKFRDKIGFEHQNKKAKLDLAINSYLKNFK